MGQEETKKEMKTAYFEMNEKENTTYHNIWAVAKAALKGNFRVRNTLLVKKKCLKLVSLASTLRNQEHITLK